MSIWSTTTEIDGLKYEGSHIYPRGMSAIDCIELAEVADCVYDDAMGKAVLPYLRVSIGTDSIVLTVSGAQELLCAVFSFLETPKWEDDQNTHTVHTFVHLEDKLRAELKKKLDFDPTAKDRDDALLDEAYGANPVPFMNWYVTLDGETILDAVTENATMTLDDALYLAHDLRVCHPKSVVTLWKGSVL